MQATENRELLEVLLHEARKPAWPRLQLSVWAQAFTSVF